MSKALRLSVSPHIHSGRSTAGIMRDVLISLVPAVMAGCLIFGARAFLVVALSVASCIFFEFLFNLIVKKEQTVGDLSAAVTGLLLGLNLPATIPLWQCMVGSAFAIIVVKGLFGGIGCNLVNPAITARVFMLVAFGSMTVQAFPSLDSTSSAVFVDTLSSATPLSGGSATLWELLLGVYGGAIGETCSIALLIGLAYLLIRRVITWHIPVSLVGTAFLMTLLLEGDAMSALVAVLSGGLLIGAIFMATDYVTSPSTAAGKLVFGVGAGVITVLIRVYGVYPEGVSFAILFMNILTPYIDALTAHKVFGRAKA